MSTTNFSDLGLSQPVLQALAECGYTEPTPIQEAAIPIVSVGHDLIASAQTGTGKTAAFTLSIIDDIATRPAKKGDTPLALVLTPTRELALQVDENVRAADWRLSAEELTQIDRLTRSGLAARLSSLLS